MVVILSAVLVLLSLGLLEHLVLQRHLRRIKIRIHVNGTRGKSTVTRLIAAGLRAGGYKVIAKTTGTLPRLILEDGSEIDLKRRGRATIREQMRVLRLAARRSADAVILECMAVHPELQWISEHRIVRSTIGVITNIRKDHMEVLGETLQGMARALALTVPQDGVLVTAEERFHDLLAEQAKRQRTRTARVPARGGVGGLPLLEPHAFRENYEVALAVCAEVGVDRETALRGMRSTRQDVGALQICASAMDGKPITFVNAFSVNDTDSLAVVWTRLIENPGVKAPIVVILNGREDRPLRAQAFGRACVGPIQADRLVLVGRAWRFARREAIQSGFPPERITHLSDLTEENLQAGLVPHLEAGCTVVGLGNYSGCGRKIAAHCAERLQHVR
jgi:poly-gamma-glutamate synthase PgsB/CapB